uniref:Uncharacterized protein n=1 Tax=Myoviridae sp. ctuJM17 TaxID=2825200 RepID=A0A8S5PKA9_9CAUD|nr:MAG TPA: hypothetical protein [Myoviridae sp. ctuJM17]
MGRYVTWGWFRGVFGLFLGALGRFLCGLGVVFEWS